MISHNLVMKSTSAYIAMLQNYLEGLKAKRLGVPQSARKGMVAKALISKETGIAVKILQRRKVHRVILKYVEEIGFSKQLFRRHIKSSCDHPFYTHKIMLYLDRLRVQGNRLPEHPEILGMPHLEKIASECAIPPRALRAGTRARSALNEGVKDLGLEVSADDPVWAKLRYRQLLEDGARLRASELVGKAHGSQQRYNTVSMLRLWMRNLALSEESFVGPELLEQFDQKLEQAQLSIRSKTTKSKFSSEMRRWLRIHRELLKQKGLPTDFRAALEMAMERSGRSAERVSELADGCACVISNWLRGDALPAKSSFPFISRIESVLKLPPGALTSLVARRQSGRFRRADYPEFTVINGVKTPLRNNRLLLGRLRPLLPDDFNQRAPEERQAMVDWLAINLLGPTTDYGLLNRELIFSKYALKKFPPILEREWQELSEFKCGVFTPAGMKRGESWSPATNKMRRLDFERIFGALALPKDAEDHRLRGMGLNPGSFTLAMLICPAVLHWWVTWKSKRRCDPRAPASGYKYTYYEASLLFIIGSLFHKETGWIRQRPDLAEHLQVVPGLIDARLIKRAKRDWPGVCQQAFDFYLHFADEVERNAEPTRDPFEPILPILESENPISALKMFAQNVLDDMPDAFAEPLQAARAMRDYMIIRLLGATALRSKNVIELTYSSDNKGELRKEKEQWVVEIPRHRFKNKHSDFFGPRKKKHGYRKVLTDVAGLYDRLEEYLNVHRQVLLQGTESDVLLVVGASCPKFTTIKFHIKYRSLTAQYLAHNPYLGRGILGVKPHGPHTVRDIVATHIIKQTGSYQIAGYALGNGDKMMKSHYARFMPEHKLALADSIMVEAWR